MKINSKIVYFLTAFLITVSTSYSQDSIEAFRKNALSNLQQGDRLRLICEEFGSIYGILIKTQNDTLFLGVEKGKILRTQSKKKLRYKPRYLEPQWKPIKRDIQIPYSLIKVTYVKKNAAFTGAIIGGIAGGGALRGEEEIRHVVSKRRAL